MQALATTLPLLARGEAPGIGIWLMAIGFAATCVIMMLVVLIQKPKGGGLSGAFGGGAGGGSSQAFVGGGIGNVLTVVTVVLFIIFLLLAGSMTLAINSGDEVPEEDDAEQVEDGAGAPDGEAVLPPVDPEPETEAEPIEETEGEGSGQGTVESAEPAAPEGSTDAPDAAEPGE